MHCKIIIVAIAIILILTDGCSSILKNIVNGYTLNVNQGNYLTSSDISKVCLGMTKQQIIYILGSPMMSDPFGSNTWFYIFHRKLGHKDIIQQTLTLTFSNSGVLTNIDNKSI